MKYLIDFTFIVNLILLILTSVGSYIMLTKNINPKNKANLATIIIFFLFVYCLSLITVSLLAIILANFRLIPLSLFAIVPMILGHFVKYDTLKKYTIYQIFFLILSMIFLII